VRPGDRGEAGAARPAAEDVAARAARDQVVAVGGVVLVPLGRADERVVPLAAADHVGARAAVDEVLAAPGVDDIVAALAVDRVVPGGGVFGRAAEVGAGPGPPREGAVPAPPVLVALAGPAAQGVVAPAAVELVGFAGDVARPHVVGPADQQVVAVVAA